MNMIVAEQQREICRELKNLVAKIEDNIKREENRIELMISDNLIDEKNKITFKGQNLLKISKILSNIFFKEKKND